MQAGVQAPNPPTFPARHKEDREQVQGPGFPGFQDPPSTPYPGTPPQEGGVQEGVQRRERRARQEMAYVEECLTQETEEAGGHWTQGSEAGMLEQGESRPWLMPRMDCEELDAEERGLLGMHSADHALLDHWGFLQDPLADGPDLGPNALYGLEHDSLAQADMGLAGGIPVDLPLGMMTGSQLPGEHLDGTFPLDMPLGAGADAEMECGAGLGLDPDYEPGSVCDQTGLSPGLEVPDCDDAAAQGLQGQERGPPEEVLEGQGWEEQEDVVAGGPPGAPERVASRNGGAAEAPLIRQRRSEESAVGPTRAPGVPSHGMADRAEKGAPWGRSWSRTVSGSGPDTPPLETPRLTHSSSLAPSPSCTSSCVSLASTPALCSGRSPGDVLAQSTLHAVHAQGAVQQHRHMLAVSRHGCQAGVGHRTELVQDTEAQSLRNGMADLRECEDRASPHQAQKRNQPPEEGQEHAPGSRHGWASAEKGEKRSKVLRLGGIGCGQAQLDALLLPSPSAQGAPANGALLSETPEVERAAPDTGPRELSPADSAGRVSPGGVQRDRGAGKSDSQRVLPGQVPSAPSGEGTAWRDGRSCEGSMEKEQGTAAGEGTMRKAVSGSRRDKSKGDGKPGFPRSVSSKKEACRKDDDRDWAQAKALRVPAAQALSPAIAVGLGSARSLANLRAPPGQAQVTGVHLPGLPPLLLPQQAVPLPNQAFSPLPTPMGLGPEGALLTPRGGGAGVFLPSPSLSSGPASSRALAASVSCSPMTSPVLVSSSAAFGGAGAGMKRSGGSAGMATPSPSSTPRGALSAQGIATGWPSGDAGEVPLGRGACGAASAGKELSGTTGGAGSGGGWQSLMQQCSSLSGTVSILPQSSTKRGRWGAGEAAHLQHKHEASLSMHLGGEREGDHSISAEARPASRAGRAVSTGGIRAVPGRETRSTSLLSSGGLGRGERGVEVEKRRRDMVQEAREGPQMKVARLLSAMPRSSSAGAGAALALDQGALTPFGGAKLRSWSPFDGGSPHSLRSGQAEGQGTLQQRQAKQAGKESHLSPLEAAVFRAGTALSGAGAASGASAAQAATTQEWVEGGSMAALRRAWAAGTVAGTGAGIGMGLAPQGSAPSMPPSQAAMLAAGGIMRWGKGGAGTHTAEGLYPLMQDSGGPDSDLETQNASGASGVGLAPWARRGARLQGPGAQEARATQDCSWVGAPAQPASTSSSSGALMGGATTDAGIGTGQFSAEQRLAQRQQRLLQLRAQVQAQISARQQAGEGHALGAPGNVSGIGGAISGEEFQGHRAERPGGAVSAPLDWCSEGAMASTAGGPLAESEGGGMAAALQEEAERRLRVQERLPLLLQQAGEVLMEGGGGPSGGAHLQSSGAHLQRSGELLERANLLSVSRDAALSRQQRKQSVTANSGGVVGDAQGAGHTLPALGEGAYGGTAGDSHVWQGAMEAALQRRQEQQQHVLRLQRQRQHQEQLALLQQAGTQHQEKILAMQDAGLMDSLTMSAMQELATKGNQRTMSWGSLPAPVHGATRSSANNPTVPRSLTTPMALAREANGPVQRPSPTSSAGRRDAAAPVVTHAGFRAARDGHLMRQGMRAAPGAVAALSGGGILPLRGMSGAGGGCRAGPVYSSGGGTSGGTPSGSLSGASGQSGSLWGGMSSLTIGVDHMRRVSAMPAVTTGPTGSGLRQGVAARSAGATWSPQMD